MADLPPPIPAATLVLMRPKQVGPPELLMMERPEHMAFAAGALVFPGGRVEDQDAEAAAALGTGLDDAAPRIAAVRETLEETGVLAGTRPLLGTDIGALRERLLAGEPFLRLLDEARVSLDLGALVPFARWCPNFRETRRFDAIFYLAEAPTQASEPSVQPGEATRTYWASARDTLAELDSGRAHAIFPTRRNLERLGQFCSFDEAREDARRHPVRTITPWIEQRGGAAWLCIPEDAGYPVTAELLESARRR